ncbi:MAG: M48 family metallopeptidase [Rubrivivax sp.]
MPIRPVNDAWRAALPHEAEAATQAYLDRLSPQAVARADAYAEGQHWLLLWNALASIAVAALLVASSAAARARDAISRWLRRPWLRDMLFGAGFVVVSTLLVFPLTLWQEFFREHAYGLATQGMGAWIGEQLMGLAVGAVGGALFVALLYAVLRRVGERWWLWGTAVTMLLLTLMVVVAPVWIQPLFNTYKPVEPGPVKDAVLAMAIANGVPTHDVLVFDASRQTTRVSANVSGLYGTASVRMNDNLQRRSTLPEIRAVMGHEIGHYAMNHIPKMLLMFGAVVLAGFVFAQWAMRRLLAWRGARWGIRGVADVASLPLLSAVLTAWLLLATPFVNTIIRSQETEADLYGMNLAREPLGMAEVLLKLTEYRKPDPGPWEEAIFFDHPSTRTRIGHAMRWREQMTPAP